MTKKIINYAVGDYWPDHPEIARIYTYRVSVFSGTPEEAEETRKFLSGRAERELKIFELVEFKPEP